MLKRLLGALFVALLTVGCAHAADLKVLTVDYSRAIQEIDEGKAAQSRLDRMYEGKKAEIEQLEADIMALQKEYESKVAVLSDAARQEYEQRLYEKQVLYQQTYANADMQMQQAYFSSMEQLMGGLKNVAEEIGRERGVDLVLEVSQGAVLYAKPELDITNDVVKRYNAKSSN
ncbi:MAG: OmpH family outer membrane protein [Alphaproteobacteria bacterium]|nr:OmpH family outer membrane protein [Alphaproteobacteria bacterium]